MENLRLRTLLDSYYQEVSTNIIQKQNPVSGLLPASTAVTTHGDYTDAWVRDNVYSILAVWGLGLAYRRLDNDEGRGKELEQRTVLLMRGLLRAMMAQSKKVEAFKNSRRPLDALHAKYDTSSGGTVVDDDAWGHLQIDATSIFLLQLAQMISSGLELIWTMDEVNFVQNLIYYIERAYRTPDYGIWERGAKTNHGRVELNASSLGMAKAALEAMDGFNLWGARGGPNSVIHVSPDNIAQAEITLHEMLPRESHTKEVDAAVLSVIGYPAFAVHDESLVDKTRAEIIEKLEGNYGLKRFLRDGHQTAVEDEERLHYEAEELKLFENIESEWPLFFTYLYLDALLRHDEIAIEKYSKRLAKLVVERDGQALLPELYIVPGIRVDAEKAKPGSQEREPNENVPLVWAQSLYLLGRMISDGVLEARDIDPLGRRLHKKPSPPVVQLLLLAEDDKLQADLAAHGVRSETLEDIDSFNVVLPEDIVQAHAQVGSNERLGLTGRSSRAIKSLSTSRFYEIDGKNIACLAPFFLQRDSYLSFDLKFVLTRFRSELKYIRRHWGQLGRPTVTLLVTRALLADEQEAFYRLMQEVQAGQVDGVPVKAGTLVQLLPTAAFERLDGITDLNLTGTSLEAVLHSNPRLKHGSVSEELEIVTARQIEATDNVNELIKRLGNTENLFEQTEILAVLLSKLGLDGEFELFGKAQTVRVLLEEVYDTAGREHFWSILRRTAGMLDKVDVDLNLACAALLVANKNIQVGRAYSDESLITSPLPDQELLRLVHKYCRDDARDRIFTLEILLYLGLLVRARPILFHSLLTIRVSHMIGLITGELAREEKLALTEAYDLLLEKAPSEVQLRLERALSRFGELESLPEELEHLHTEGTLAELAWKDEKSQGQEQEPEDGWLAWRQYQGVMDRREKAFYDQVWQVFKHAPALVIGDKLDRKNHVESKIILSDMTSQEPAFALLLEHLLNKISSPEYRQLNLEALSVIAEFCSQNPEIMVTDSVYLDAVIGHGVRQLHLKRHPEQLSQYESLKAVAWKSFYKSSPIETREAFADALRYLLSQPASGRRSA